MFRCQEAVDKFVDYARVHGDRLQYADALWIQLPEGPLYSILEGRFPHPARTYETIALILEEVERKRINTLIGERRTRLGSTLSDVTVEVKREVYGQSKLEHIYRQLINWTSDDDTRRTYEEKLLQRCYGRLLVSPAASKAQEQATVLGLANDMVIIKHPYKLAWDIAIDWQDHKEVKDWDVNVLREYCAFFPDSDMYKVITGYLTSILSPFPPPSETAKKAPSSMVASDESEDDEDGGVPTLFVPLTDDERLIMIAEGISGTESLFAYRLAGQYLVHFGEYESTVEFMRKAQQFIAKERSKTGMPFLNTYDAYSLSLGTALVYYQSPRHHQEAKALFDKILEHDETSTPAMIGVGLIFEEEEEYEEAIDFLDRALGRDPSNIRVKSEAAWVKALAGDWQAAKDELFGCIALLQGKDTTDKDLLADTQYRIGCCLWNLDTSRQARKQRKGECAYAYWIAALSNNMNHAPTYTSLGIFYNDYAKDRNRARRCFQKALELSSAEVVAAERLARSFAEDGDWDRVELVAQRVVDSGKVKPPPGSKRKGISWPFAALGVAQLNKRDLHKAIVSFQAALRLSPNDYYSWVGLGESYHSSGRYMAATKAITNAQTIEAEGRGAISGDTWSTQYMLGNVKRELGDFDEAIVLYQSVLDTHPGEEGVVIALMQTQMDSAFSSIDKGLFGKAVQLASDTINFAAATSGNVRNAFNFWKSLGDACSVFSSVQSFVSDFPAKAVKELLKSSDQQAFDILESFDKVGTSLVYGVGAEVDGGGPTDEMVRCLHATILCHKVAIHVSSWDRHAQAVAHHNLGWAELRAHTCLLPDQQRKSRNFIEASMRAFKRSIELENGNAEFWNALGVASSDISPSVAQHAFVRSLHVDERSPAAWTNLGTLALLSGDVEAANEAYTRAQSADPDYAHSWVGQGFVALLLGNTKEARSLFTHAMLIAEGSSIAARRHYAASIFDHMMMVPASMTTTSLIQPLFALNQMQRLLPQDVTFGHLSTLFQERTGERRTAVQTLERICTLLEADYEATESADSLAKFTLAKADLARAYLAVGSNEKAVECGETALGLSGDEGESELSGEQRKRARLSAHLTVGLGKYFQKAYDEALECFEAALEESDKNPDATCLLAQVLWAQGSEESRERARTALFGTIEQQPDHVRSVLLLGVMALLDRDEDSVEAVVEELQRLRTKDGVTMTEQRQISEVLDGISSLDEGRTEQDMLAQVQEEVMLRPHLPHGWSSLAKATGNWHAAQMALVVAAQGVPPRGALEAQDLAATYAGTGKVGDAQRAAMLAPWAAPGWESLRAAAAGG